MAIEFLSACSFMSETFMFNYLLGARKRTGENINAQFREELSIYIRKYSESSGGLHPRVLIEWLHLLEGIMIGWHRKIATNQGPNYTPSGVTIHPYIRLVILVLWTSVHMPHQIWEDLSDLEPKVMTKSNDYNYHIYGVSPVQDRGIKIFREEPTYLFHISCVGGNQSREFQSFSLQTEILILSPTGVKRPVHWCLLFTSTNGNKMSRKGSSREEKKKS